MHVGWPGGPLRVPFLVIKHKISQRTSLWSHSHLLDIISQKNKVQIWRNSKLWCLKGCLGKEKEPKVEFLKGMNKSFYSILNVSDHSIETVLSDVMRVDVDWHPLLRWSEWENIERDSNSGKEEFHVFLFWHVLHMHGFNPTFAQKNHP